MATVIGFDQKQKLQCICGKCTAIIEYIPNEVRVHKYIDYGGGTNTDRYVLCPNCGEKVYL